MRLAGCLLFDAEKHGGIERNHPEERANRADENYREVIATEDPEFYRGSSNLFDCSLNAPHCPVTAPVLLVR
jgi:hypothetical protein